MGDMTRTQFKAELTGLFSNANDVWFTDDARRNRWIREAYRYMCHPSVHRFREVQTTYTYTLATGVNSYSLSQATVSYHVIAVRYVVHVIDTAYSATVRKRKLNPRGVRWFMEKTLSPGQPTIYTIDGEELLVSGVPRASENNQLLRVGVYREVADFANDAATTILPGYFDRPLLKLIQAFALADRGDADLALVVMREAQQLLNNAQEEGEMEAEDTGWQTEFITYPAVGPVR